MYNVWKIIDNSLDRYQINILGSLTSILKYASIYFSYVINGFEIHITILRIVS